MSVETDKNLFHYAHFLVVVGFYSTEQGRISFPRRSSMNIRDGVPLDHNQNARRMRNHLGSAHLELEVLGLELVKRATFLRAADERGRVEKLHHALFILRASGLLE